MESRNLTHHQYGLVSQITGNKQVYNDYLGSIIRRYDFFIRQYVKPVTADITTLLAQAINLTSMI